MGRSPKHKTPKHDSNFVPKVHPKTEAEIAHISKALKDNHRFSEILHGFNEAETLQFIGYLEKTRFSAGVDIISQGDNADYFYVVESGKCDVFVKGQGKVVCRSIEPGDTSPHSFFHPPPKLVSSRFGSIPPEDRSGKLPSSRSVHGTRPLWRPYPHSFGGWTAGLSNMQWPTPPRWLWLVTWPFSTM